MLNALGVEDFGIYNIVGGVVILFSFINNALSSATQRFLNFEIGRGDVLGTKRVFSMSLTIHLFVALFVVLLAETVGLWFLNTQMNIPTERMAAANLVYQFSILTVWHQLCTNSILCKRCGIRKDVFFCIHCNYRSYTKAADCSFADLCRF